jgi:hypothetical protein
MSTLPRHSSRSSPQLDHFDAPKVSEQQSRSSAAFSTVSTARSALSKDGITSQKRTSKIRKSRQLKCQAHGCTHKGTFPRTWELQRHVQAKHHEGAGSFVCYAERCFKKQLRWTFTRSDKLTAHIKSTHARDKVFTACPVNACGFGESTLEELGVHLQRVHGDRGNYKDYEEGRGVFNASTCRVCKCPLWRCGKHVKARELLSHIASHDTHQILTATTKLASEGLIIVESDCASREVGLAVQCPMCKAMSATIDEFITHLWTSHFFLAGSDQTEHFNAWKFALVRIQGEQKGGISLLSPWRDSEIFESYFHQSYNSTRTRFSVLYVCFRPTASEAVSTNWQTGKPPGTPSQLITSACSAQRPKWSQSSTHTACRS